MINDAPLSAGLFQVENRYSVIGVSDDYVDFVKAAVAT